MIIELERPKSAFEKIECSHCKTLMGYSCGDLYYLDEPTCVKCYNEGSSILDDE